MTQGFIGEVGRLQKVWTTPSMSMSKPVERSFEVTLGGRRVVRQAVRGHREWDVTADAAGVSDASVLSMFADGSWGVGPWWWLSPYATGVNMLTPDGSLMKAANMVSGATTSGPVMVEGGRWLPSSAVVSGAQANGIGRSVTAGVVPVIPTTFYTVSMFASVGQAVRMTFFNANNVSVGSATSPVAASGSGLQRVFVTRGTPASAVAIRVDAVGAGQCAGAALSMTSELVPWAVGDGCQYAIVETEARSVDRIMSDPWVNQSFTIKEVG